MTSAERAALWTLVGVFVVFKVVTTAAMVYFAPRGLDTTIGLFIAFHWPVAVAGLVVAAAPALFWWRLVRVRRRRAQLQAQEWQVDPASPPRESVR